MSSEIVTSAGIVGTYPDAVNDRFRGLAPGFITNPDVLRHQWHAFLGEANAQPASASRLTLRVVTTPEAAAQSAPHVPAEAYIPLTAQAGLLYLAVNASDRRAQLPLGHINATTDAIASDIARRFRPPTNRLEELRQRGYHFVDHVIDPASLLDLWGGTFGWTAPMITNLRQRLTANALLPARERDLWFTGVMHQDHLVAAALAERLDVPGPAGPLPTIESTEWVVGKDKRHAGIAAGMLALNAAQCLNDVPQARVLAECRFSSTAYAAGMSIGFAVPDRDFSPQILERNVWVDGELADFVPLSLPDAAIRAHYTPTDRQTMLNHLNQ